MTRGRGRETAGPASPPASRRRYRMVVRAQRQERSRERIVGAMKAAVMAKPYSAIRVADIARDAGVSAPTVHQHFETKEALFLAATKELAREVLALRGEPPRGDVRAAVRALVRAYERYGDANWRLLPLEAESTAVAAVLRQGRAGHRAWLEDVFGPLLAQSPTRRRHLLEALYAATDVGTWKLLRRDLGLSRARTIAVIETLVLGAVARSDDTRAATDETEEESCGS